MKKICFEKLYTKCDGETIARPFSKKSNLSTSLDNSLQFYVVCFHWTPGVSWKGPMK